MSKIRGLRGPDLKRIMDRVAPKGRHRAAYGDKKDHYPEPHKPLVYAPVSAHRVNGGIPYRKQPIGARQPQWSYDPESATAREEHVAMLVDGDIKGTWREANRSGNRLDVNTHRKVLSQLSKQEAAKDKIRGEVFGKRVASDQDASNVNERINSRREARKRAMAKVKARMSNRNFEKS